MFCLVSLNKFVSNLRSMSHRPQRSKFAYTVTSIFFALLMCYMLFCSAWLTVKGMPATIASLEQKGQKFGQSTVKVIFRNRIFRDLIVSTTGTYALYLLSSILFFDFLHMFTSFVQYLLLLPSYINILYSLR